MATCSQTPGIFSGQTKTNPKGHINVVTIRDGNQLEDPVKKSKNIEGEVESNKPLSEEVIRKSKKTLDSPTHKPKIPFPQRLAKPNLEAHFNKFVNILKKINILFAKAFSRMPLYAKLLKEFF